MSKMSYFTLKYNTASAAQYFLYRCTYIERITISNCPFRLTLFKKKYTRICNVRIATRKYYNRCRGESLIIESTIILARRLEICRNIQIKKKNIALLCKQNNSGLFFLFWEKAFKTRFFYLINCDRLKRI